MEVWLDLGRTAQVGYVIEDQKGCYLSVVDSAPKSCLWSCGGHYMCVGDNKEIVVGFGTLLL